MIFIENAWSVIKVSAVSWLSVLLGGALTFYAYVNTSAPNIQEALHFSAWSQWVPWLLGLATTFGIPVGRVVRQQAVTNAANK